MSAWRKLSSIATDLARVNARYLADGGQRNRMREVLKRDGMSRPQRVIFEREVRAAVPAAQPYAGLASSSLTLAGIRVEPALEPRVNLLIGEVREGGMFAGVHTALTVAKALSRKLGLPLRVVMLDFTSLDNDRARAQRFIAERFELADVTVVPREDIRDAPFGSRDVWVATHSKTAHTAQVACSAGLIDATRVIYLIQDYEPGFSPWSTESVLATATYHAGFLPIVNSTPLWRFLSDQEGLEIDPDLVIAPSFEDDRLRSVAAARHSGDRLRVLFYARPSKHRNLYQLGISALRATVLALGDEADSVDFYSAGEDHEDVDLGFGRSIIRLGRMPWDDYFAFLSTTSVMLSLQQSPHPSHPPFDAAISGAMAVTNEFHGTRAHMHPRILATPADTASLADALVSVIRGSAGAPRSEYLAVESGSLGRPLDEVIEFAISHLNSAGPPEMILRKPSESQKTDHGSA